MTTSNDPDAIRADIEQTRQNLSQNVNALGEAVQPSTIAKRQVDKAKGAAVGLKDKVMGTAEDAVAGVGDRASGVGDSASSLKDSVASAPDLAKQQTQGNPLAAGLIALGAGWLLGSLLPASNREQDAAEALKEHAKPLVGEAQDVAKEAVQNLKEPALEAADSVKSSAQDAVQTVKDQGQSAAQDVKESANESKDAVQEHQSRPGTSL